MDPRICPFGSSSVNFFAFQRFHEDSRSWSWCRKSTTGVHMMAYDTLTNGQMFLWSPPNLKISFIVSIWGQFRDSVRPAVWISITLRSVYVAIENTTASHMHAILVVLYHVYGACSLATFNGVYETVWDCECLRIIGDTFWQKLNANTCHNISCKLTTYAVKDM